MPLVKVMETSFFKYQCWSFGCHHIGFIGGLSCHIWTQELSAKLFS